MSYDLERKLIANFANSQSFFGLDPFALDGERSSLTVPGGGVLDILNGEPRKVALDGRVEYPGVVKVTIASDISGGSRAATSAADVVCDALRELSLGEDGLPADGSSVIVLSFKGKGRVPHVTARQIMGKLILTTVTAPFVRYQNH